MSKKQKREVTRNGNEGINELSDAAEKAAVRRNDFEIMQEELSYGANQVVQQQNPRNIGFAIDCNIKNQVYAVKNDGGNKKTIRV